MITPTRDRISDERLSDAELQEYIDGFEQLKAIGIDATKDPDGLSLMRLVYEVKAHRAAEEQRPTCATCKEWTGRTERGTKLQVANCKQGVSIGSASDKTPYNFHCAFYEAELLPAPPDGWK